MYFERAAEYAAHRPSYPPGLGDWLARAAPARDDVWEAGCGSGQLSLPLAGHFARVIATDAEPAQLAHAQPHARVRYVAARAEAAPIRAASVDLVVAAQAAHWFDLSAFYAEARRVARAGAVVALIAYGNAVLDSPALNERFLRFYDDDMGRWWPPERRIIEDGYRTIDFPFAELDPPALELRALWTADQMLGYIGTWSALRRYERAGEDARVIARFAAELRALWGAGARPVRWPMPMRVGRVD
jgi:SAM-dependent methyltransferase